MRCFYFDRTIAMPLLYTQYDRVVLLNSCINIFGRAPMADKKLDPPAYTSAVEVEWSEALQLLEKKMVIYRHAKIGGASEDITL